MEKNDNKYQAYLEIMRSELLTATGCTEPISIALAAARARDVLGATPTRVEIYVSEAILKNAKSVIVPNTNNKKGIKVAAAAGIIFGDPVKELDVLTDVHAESFQMIEKYLDTTKITVQPIESEYIFDVELTALHNDDYARVRIINTHTNFVLIEKNNEVIFRKDYIGEVRGDAPDKKLLTVKEIVDFANILDIKTVQSMLDKQIENNSKIADEGLLNDYGANIGSVLMKVYGDDIKNTAKAKAAAASDARMSGSRLPVTIVSGSGNQGLTASIPVIEYAKYLKVSDDKLYRALVISNLVSIHQKTGVGTLSAYCGAVFAGTGAGAGIAYLHDGDFEAIAHTIVNALAIVSGMICDGAKPSCAAKIAASVDAGILGYMMYRQNQEFLGGDGIIAKGVENTIANVNRLARDGMKITDKEIVKIMSQE